MKSTHRSTQQTTALRALALAAILTTQVAIADEAMVPTATATPAATAINPEATASDVSELYKTLRLDARRAMDRLKNYPNLNSYSVIDPRAWIFASRESEQARLIRQMDFAQNKLGDSKLVRLKVLFDQGQAEMALLRQQNIDLKLQLQTAVSKKELSWLTSLLLPVLPQFIAPSVAEDIAARIERNEARAQQIKTESVQQTAQISEALRELGVQVDGKQLDILMTTVTGKQDLQLVSAFNNVRRLVVMIQSQLKPDTTIEVAREYYGMYTLMLAALVQMQNSQVDRINNVYLTRLSELSDKVAQNSSQADDLMKESHNPEMLKVNKRANEQMLTLVNRYREFLQEKVKRIQASAAEQRKVYLEALNTYSTYDVAVGLLEAIETHQKELRSFDAAILEMPNLIDVGDLTLNQQISRISVEIDRGR